LYFYLSKILAPFLNPINFLIFFLILFYLTNLRLKKILIKFLITLILLISFFPIGEKGIFYLERDYILQNKIAKIDNILVLAGSEDIHATSITKKLNLGDSSERLIASVKLALENPNSIVYFLGGDGNLVKSKLDEADVAQIFFNDVGFDITRVKFINNTRNTIENLKAFKKLNINNKSNVLITSASHMKRAMLIAEKINIKVIPYAVDFRATRKFQFSILNFIQGFNISSNLSAFNNFFREILGILAFKIFY
tara:strand:- start:83 stop:841 length:759 start_codon:yes stop_codon:yes gene_type:complete